MPPQCARNDYPRQAHPQRQQWADVVDVPDVGNRSSHTVEACPITSMNINDLPDDIKGKLSVLTIAKNNQYMEQVGRRVSEKSFWVER